MGRASAARLSRRRARLSLRRPPSGARLHHREEGGEGDPRAPRSSCHRAARRACAHSRCRGGRLLAGRRSRAAAIAARRRPDRSAHTPCFRPARPGLQTPAAVWQAGKLDRGGGSKATGAALSVLHAHAHHDDPAWHTLRSYETIVNLIANTTNYGGLIVRARLDRRDYPTGRKVSAKEFRALNIERDDFQRDWNYVIRPRGKKGWPYDLFIAGL